MWAKYAFISFLLLGCSSKKESIQTETPLPTSEAVVGNVDTGNKEEEDCDEKAKKEQLKKIENLDLSKTDPGCTLDE